MEKSLKLIDKYLKSNPPRKLYLLKMSNYSIVIIAAFIYYFINVEINWYSIFLNDNIQSIFIWFSSWFWWFIPIKLSKKGHIDIDKSCVVYGGIGSFIDNGVQIFGFNEWCSSCLG